MPQSSEPDERASVAYGFVGTGEIAAAIVEGLGIDAGTAPPVFLSPRGRAVGQRLAERFPNVRVCDSNQDVLDHATAIVLAVRPPLAREVLAELSFRPEHTVVSALAGVRLDDLRGWAAPAARVVRSIPLPTAARGRSLTVVYPEDPVARALFDRLGGLVVPAGEDAFEVFSAATGTFAAHLDYLATIARWLADHGIDHDDATAYTAHIFGQLGQTLLESDDSLAVLTEKHLTPGGFNEQLLNHLRRDGVPDAVRKGLDGLLVRLRG
ncbi:NAD(P)-binding domain-containing protein [Actinosynnema sp. NPDC047251]|uniref:Pyrroline-5-carboxylate reductase n=1 Tax=Saccharothrix espanaensis (strain ATCC 51144 / DSM 44229 / JCM 9112 / NBRC 15066 / NRRL 15764) TaxID=1179773 RepID=K0K6W6_SACES|nr:NAD(P)-binding domain-containing protein [Saccharothrix espanaensis]CCH33277.1 Pyrroline-5-carboxylate reductase [Saccharothrix espanaensis DSM 44229]